MSSSNTPRVHCIETEVAKVWIAYLHQDDANYHYGGSRLVAPQTSDDEVEQHLHRLMREESQLKNLLINRTLAREDLAVGQGRLPKGVAGSRVGGGRCLIRPASQALHDIFSDPTHPRFAQVLNVAFEAIGQQLNALGGAVKLTPDFGRFADCSNHLFRYTEHVLGIGCDEGGCGGKSSYSTSGILGGMLRAGLLEDPSVPTLVIGSAGALGSEIVEHLRERGFTQITLCDILYDQGEVVPPLGLPVLPAQPGKFTDQALQHGHLIIAATWGHELEQSNHGLLPRGTRLVLAHNLCLPAGEEGRQLARALDAAGVFVMPGALLTLGGALTSRLEWFHRQERRDTPFDKVYAHRVAHDVVAELTTEVLRVSRQQRLSPYEAMQRVAEADA